MYGLINTNNTFLQFLSYIKNDWDEKVISEIEDFDELDEVFDVRFDTNNNIHEIIQISLNPVFDIKNSAKLGIKSRDWIERSKRGFTKLEERLILSSL